MTELAEHRCPVCGAEVDGYGCIGEYQGRHVPIEMEKLRARIRELEADNEKLRKLLEGAFS